MNHPLPSDAEAILRTELLKRIKKCRDALEHESPNEWANLERGRIKAFRELLEWIEPKPHQPEPAERRLSQPPNY